MLIYFFVNKLADVLKNFIVETDYYYFFHKYYYFVYISFSQNASVRGVKTYY